MLLKDCSVRDDGREERGRARTMILGVVAARAPVRHSEHVPLKGLALRDEDGQVSLLVFSPRERLRDGRDVAVLGAGAVARASRSHDSVAVAVRLWRERKPRHQVGD